MQQSEGPIFKRRPDRRAARLTVGLLLALALHLGFAGLIAVFAVLGWLDNGLASKPSVTEPVALLNLPPSQWEQNRSVDKKPPKADQTSKPQELQKEQEKKKPEEMPKGQVVDVAPGNDQKPDADTKYLAEHNNKVDKQSKAKDQTPFYKNAMPHRTTTLPPPDAQGHDAVDKPTVAGNDGTGNDAQEKKEAQKGAGHMELPSVQKREQMNLAMQGKDGEIKNQSESDEVRGNSQRLRVTPGQPGAPEQEEAGSLGRLGGRNQMNLMPSQAQLDKITGAAANDHLDDVDEGQGTFLNTREFKYSTFFNRVKQRVGENWDPSTPLRQRDPEGRVYAYKDRYTMLSVALDQKGRVLQITVEKSCGVDFLDHEAVAAFERAQPFPNPPPGLVDSQGLVKFTFGFFLEVNSGNNFRIFRSRD